MCRGLIIKGSGYGFPGRDQKDAELNSGVVILPEKMFLFCRQLFCIHPHNTMPPPQYRRFGPRSRSGLPSRKRHRRRPRDPARRYPEPQPHRRSDRASGGPRDHSPGSRRRLDPGRSRWIRERLHRREGQRTADAGSVVGTSRPAQRLQLGSAPLKPLTGE